MENKKRSLAQRIGETGEALVKLWASKNLLSANKLDNDYGFDFLLQHFQPHGKHEIHTGLWFMAQCKATESDEQKYVKLDREDAYLYLSASIPVCLLSVDNKSEQVRFRFIDQELIDELIHFVNSNNYTKSLNIDKYFLGLESLQDCIKEHATSHTTQKLKVYTANKLLKVFSPDIQIGTFTTDGKFTIHLKAKWITSVINPDSLFNDMSKSADDVIDFNIIQILKDYLPTFNALSISGSIGAQNEMSASNAKNITTCISYPHKGDLSYRTKLGFVLTAGPCIIKKGTHIHKVKYELKPSPYGFSECADDCLAFEEMFDKKQLAINGHVLVPDFNNWKGLEGIFYIVKEISKAINTGIFDFASLKACDLEIKNVSITVGIISTLINNKSLSSWFPGFLFGAKIQPKNLKTINGSGRVPLAFSIKQNKFIAWLTCEYSWLTDSKLNQIKGFKFDSIMNVEIVKLEWEEREIPLPELWLHSSWPSVPLGNKYKRVQLTDEIRPFSIIED